MKDSDPTPLHDSPKCGVIPSAGVLQPERGISVSTNVARQPRRTIFAATILALTITAAAQSPQELITVGHTDEAIESLQQKIASNPTDAAAHNLLCRAYFQLEEWDHAISSCERAIAIDPRNSLYHLWLGRAFGEKADKAGFLSAAGLAKKVRTEFERAVELDPKSWEARTDLAEFYVEAPGIVGGGKDKAQSQADALASLKPAMQHYIQGRIAEKNNKDNLTAEREYKAAIESSQGGAHAWLNLALFYRHTNRLEEMDKAIHTMETRPMDRPESLMDGASILFRTNRQLPFAIELLKRYLKSPVEAEPVFKAHYLLGQILEKQGDRKAAVEEYRAALAQAHTFKHAEEALRRLDH
jgi:tetratricopeptide (TPR) repeat protein